MRCWKDREVEYIRNDGCQTNNDPQNPETQYGDTEGEDIIDMELIKQKEHYIPPKHIEFTMCEINDSENAEHQCQTQRYQDVEHG